DDLLVITGYKEQQKRKISEKKKSQQKSLVIVDGTEGLEVIFAKCCNPIPGDRIVAISSKRGLVIHRANCINILNIDNVRKFPAFWRTDINAQFSVLIKMELDKKERVPDLLSRAMEKKIEIRNFKFEDTADEYVIVSLNVTVNSLEQLEEIINFFKSSPGVRKVVRF
ncbi:MAG: ACT domain-containing protein, partial [Fervidobacterium sp.]